MLRSAWQGWRRDPAAAPVVAVVSTRDPFHRALTISLLNPKAILFFLSFFIQFVDRSYPYPALSFVVLGLIAQIASFAYLSTLILRSEEHTSELQSLMRISYAVFCLKKQNLRIR